MIGLEQARSGSLDRLRAAPANAAALGERVILAASALLLVVQELLFSAYTVDDAFITFRYARNLASGLGLVFNSGERVEGYTNFLWTVLMAGGYRLGFDLVIFAKLVGIAASFGTLYVLFKLSTLIRPYSSRSGTRALATLLLAANGAFATAAITGLETSLFILLVTAGAYFYVRHLPSDDQTERRGEPRLQAGDLSAICFALSAMTRPEGVAVFVFGLLLLPLSNGFKASTLTTCARWLGIFVAIFLPYYLWRFSYYGYPFPNTYYAKTGAGIGQYVKGLIDLGLFSSTYHALFFPPALLVLVRRRARLVTPFLAPLAVLYVVIVVLGLVSPTYLALLFVVSLFILVLGPRAGDLRGSEPMHRVRHPEPQTPHRPESEQRALSRYSEPPRRIPWFVALRPAVWLRTFQPVRPGGHSPRLTMTDGPTGADSACGDHNDRPPADRAVSSWLTYVAGLVLFYTGIAVYEGGDWIPFFRMMMPILPLYYLLLQEGLVQASTTCSSYLRDHTSLSTARSADGGPSQKLTRLTWTWAQRGLVAALVLATLGPSVEMTGKLKNLAIGYERAHLTLAQWLTSNSRGPVALMDIGLIGYLSNLEIVDTSGLTDLYIAHSPGGLIDKKFDLAYVLERDPEYFVLTSTTDFAASGGQPTDFPIDQRIYDDERFTGTYRHLFTLDAGWREKGKGYFLAVFGRR